MNSPKHDHVGPDKRCPQCKGFIVGKPTTLKSAPGGSKEFCSSDCLLDYWEARNKKKEPR